MKLSLVKGFSFLVTLESVSPRAGSSCCLEMTALYVVVEKMFAFVEVTTIRTPQIFLSNVRQLLPILTVYFVHIDRRNKCIAKAVEFGTRG